YCLHLPPEPLLPIVSLSFFFIPPAPSVISTLSLHDALPICDRDQGVGPRQHGDGRDQGGDHRVVPVRGAQVHPPRAVDHAQLRPDRKSTRLNSSHVAISYAVFCLKKKIKHQQHSTKHHVPIH